MYVDQAGMIDRCGEVLLIQLTDRATPNTGAINLTVLSRALSDAAAVIHGYARSAGYSVPFAPTPDMVAGWQAAIALYLLYRDKASEKAAKDYDAALAQLKDLAAGRVTLQVAGATAPAPDQETTILYSAGSRVMTGRSLEGF